MFSLSSHSDTKKNDAQRSEDKNTKLLQSHSFPESVRTMTRCMQAARAHWRRKIAIILCRYDQQCAAKT